MGGINLFLLHKSQVFKFFIQFVLLYRIFVSKFIVLAEYDDLPNDNGYRSIGV